MVLGFPILKHFRVVGLMVLWDSICISVYQSIWSLPREREIEWGYERCQKKGEKILTYETKFVLFLAVLENSVLPMG